MVLRRLPLLLALLALAAVGGASGIVATPAHAQQPAGYDDGSYDDGGFDDEAQDTSGYESDDDFYDDGGELPPAIAPAPPTAAPTPTPTPTPPPTPLTPAPIATLPTIPVTRMVPGRVALLRTDGKAAIPRGAPKRVQAIIAAANRIVGKPYKWGGGHAKLIDRGYDCSGAVSYALIGAGLLGSPLVSGSLARWSAGGTGNWVNVYANKGHVYMEVAGLRLDTSPVGDVTRRTGVRWRPAIGRRSGFATRHPAGL